MATKEPLQVTVTWVPGGSVQVKYPQDRVVEVLGMLEAAKSLITSQAVSKGVKREGRIVQPSGLMQVQ